MSTQTTIKLGHLTLTNNDKVQLKSNDNILHKKQILDLISDNNFKIVGEDNFIHNSISDLSDFFETTDDSVRTRMNTLITQVGINLANTTGNLRTEIDRSQEEIRDESEALHEYIVNEALKDTNNLNTLSEEVFDYHKDKSVEIFNLRTSILTTQNQEIQAYRKKGSDAMYLVDSEISFSIDVLSNTIETDYSELKYDYYTLSDNLSSHKDLNLSRESEISELLINIDGHHKTQYDTLYPRISNEIVSNNLEMDVLSERFYKIQTVDLYEFSSIKNKIVKGKENYESFYDNLDTILDQYDIVDKHYGHSDHLENMESTHTEWSDGMYATLSNEVIRQEVSMNDINSDFTDKKNELFKNLNNRLDTEGGFLTSTSKLKTKQLHLGPFWRIRSNDENHLVFEYYDTQSQEWIVTFPFIATEINT